MSRVYNFSAGPAVLPEEVLKEAAAEMLDYNGCGMSVMEMSHRSSVFQEIIETAEADIRELMHIPDNYKVLFLQESKHRFHLFFRTYRDTHILFNSFTAPEAHIDIIFFQCFK